MPGTHLRGPGCKKDLWTINKKQKKNPTGDSRYVYQNELDKACL